MMNTEETKRLFKALEAIMDLLAIQLESAEDGSPNFPQSYDQYRYQFGDLK